MVFAPGCGPAKFWQGSALTDSEKPVLSVMALSSNLNAAFEQNEFETFARQHQAKQNFIPALQSVNDRLALFQRLLRDRSPNPDLYEIDVIWPAILADDLVDLTPYFGDDLRSFDPEILQSYTVHGRLVAIPTIVDTGVLYYRPELLNKYGFHNPPKTWKELEQMARTIQRGERRDGNREFWGYVWQGANAEALTCNAFEWQTSEGAGEIIGPGKTVRVFNQKMINLLNQKASWIGTISPPGESVYGESDGLNLWFSGKAAFMRSWMGAYPYVRKRSQPGWEVAIAALPGGSGGQRGTLGGVGIGVSRYAANRDLAILAIKSLTSEAAQIRNAERTGTVPTRTALSHRPDIMAHTALQGQLATEILSGIVARPSLLAGTKYDAVSRAYFEAVHG